MKRAFSDNIERIRALCIEHNVKSLYAFGSVCKKDENDANDVDLLISFNKMDYGEYADNYFSLADQLEALFNKPVDLVTKNSLHNPYFIDSVNKTKVLIYASDD